MGSKAAKVILPLVAIAGVGIATGGFGLMGGTAAAGAGAGAGAAGAGAAAGTGAATAATGMGAGLAASAVPVGAMSTLSSAGFPMTTTAALQAGTTAATAAPAASGGFFSSLIGPEGIFAYKDAAMLGLTGAGQVMSGMANAGAMAYQAGIQENAMKLQAAEDAVNLAEAEKDSQRRLREVLATQEVFYGATGTAASSGSALQAAEAAKRKADDELSLFATERQVAAANPYQRRRVNRTGMFAGSLLDFGISAIDRARV